MVFTMWALLRAFFINCNFLTVIWYCYCLWKCNYLPWHKISHFLSFLSGLTYCCAPVSKSFHLGTAGYESCRKYGGERCQPTRVKGETVWCCGKNTSLVGQAALGKLFHLPRPQFPHLYNSDNRTSFMFKTWKFLTWSQSIQARVFLSSCLKSQSLWASLVALHSACYPHLLDCWVLWGRDCLFFTFHLYQPVQLRAETESLWMAVTLGCIQLCRGIYNNARCLEKSWEIWKEAEQSKESLVLCHLVTYH